MANAPAPASSAEPGFFEALAAKPDRLRTILLILNLVCYTFPFILIAASRGWLKAPQFAVVATIVMDVFVSAATLIFVMPSQRRTLTDAERLRILTLTFAALIGLTVAVIGMVLPFNERL